MTAGIILVISILVLGGVIATVSDRLGTKVGKARLSLFKLRPRTTAVIVTMVTGTVLSGLTLTILFAASKPLRRGVFRFDEIQERLNQSRKDLTQTSDEKERVEAELEQARASLNEAWTQLNKINFSLDQANTQATETETRLQQTQNQLQQTQSQLNELQSQLSNIDEAKRQTELELNQTENQLQEVVDQKQLLESEIQGLQAERQTLIKQREQVQAQIQERDRALAQQEQRIAEQDQVIGQQDQVIEERDQVIAQREKLLKELEVEQAKLEEQQAFLKEQFKLVERDFQLLREGSVVLRRGEILASGLIRVKDPKQSTEIVHSLLQEANRNAMNSVQLGNSSIEKEQVIQITKAEIEELIDGINDGRDYVVQIISAANYLAGESRVAVFTKAEPNRLLFTSGEVIAGTSIQPSTLSDSQLQQQLEQLLDASRFRARFVGILDVDGLIQIGDARVETLVNFFEQLQKHDQPVELQAVAAEDTYTIGPLRIDLLARHNGQIILSTRSQDQKTTTQENIQFQSPSQTQRSQPDNNQREGNFRIDRTRSFFNNRE